MITLPAAISNNKDKISKKPVILIEFEDLDYHVASKELDLQIFSDPMTGGGSGTTFTAANATFETWNTKAGDKIYFDDSSETIEIASVTNETTVVLDSTPSGSKGDWTYYQVYYDLLKKDGNVKTSTSISQLVRGIGAVGNFTVTLVDWEGTCRADIVGTSPDLTDSGVNVFFMFNTDDTYDVDDRVQIAKGKISTYKVVNDTMVINIKAVLPALSKIPASLFIEGVVADVEVSDTYFSSDSIPIHFGNFHEGVNHRAWAQTGGNRFAICPLLRWDTDTDIATYKVADHEMHTMPGTGDMDDPDDAHGFVVRDNKYVALDCDSSGVTVRNTASGAEIDLSVGTNKEAYLYLPARSEGAANLVTDWEDCIDGSNVTYCTVDNSETILEVDDFGFDELVDNQLEAAGTSIYCYVYFGSIIGTGNALQLEVTDGVNTASTYRNATNANSWAILAFPSACSDITKIDDYSVKVTQLIAGSAANVHTVLIRIQTQDLSDADKYLYIECRGRKYGGTWNSRKTAANLITYAPEIIESLLRDQWSFGDSDIDMDAFDNVNDYHKLTAFVLAAGSFYLQKDGYKQLKAITEQFNICLFYSLPNNKWRLVTPLAAANDFSSSGTGTPGNEDIFTDDLTRSGDEYTQHPIIKDTFKLSRSSENERFGKFVVNYVRTHMGYIRSVETGSGKEIVLNNDFVQGIDSAENLRDVLDDWLLQQKWICTFRTSYNAIAHEIGDVINIRHSRLNNDMLDATVNTQKWMIIKHSLSWHPGQIEITAIEMY